MFAVSKPYTYFSIRNNNCALLSRGTMSDVLAQSIDYVKKVKVLEELKNASTFPENILKEGKYILIIKSDLICINRNNRVQLKDFKDVASLTSDGGKPLTVLLDALSIANEKIVCLFAVDLTVTSEQEIKQLESKFDGIFVNARESLLKLDEREHQFVLQAKGLIHFNKTFVYCPLCGNQLVRNVTGSQKHCLKCEQTHYPHVFPVVIVLLEDKMHEKVLLVRQERHPPGMYSCVAGFVEPGETLDLGVRREVAEEVGLTLITLEYFKSQPWTRLSSQLMLGFIGTVDNENLELDEKEIENAIWIQADRLKDAINHSQSVKSITEINTAELWVPPSSTISNQLMVEWLRRYHSFS